MRLFIALGISDSLTGVIHRWQNSQAKQYPALKWTGENRLHLTLRFLGNLKPQKIIDAMKALNLTEFLPLEYTLSRSGSFGNPATVAWLSGSFAPQLFLIANRLASIPCEQGKTGEERSFFPHITVARAKRGSSSSVPSFNQEVKETSNSIHLMNSRLTRYGPVYSTVYTLSI